MKTLMETRKSTVKEQKRFGNHSQYILRKGVLDSLQIFRRGKFK